jgi:glycylpeptide N-tetradecanoyltransferase
VALPAGFEWATLDITDDKQAEELFELLKENYVEDSEHTFRFEYTVEFLRWSLMVAGYIKDWHVGVRVTKTGKLYGFISGTPVKLGVKDKNVKMA